MDIIVSVVALVVSALTITQGVRTLSDATRLRDRITKDLAIRKELPDGPVKDALTEGIEEAALQLVVIDKHPTRWWVLPFVVFAAGSTAAALAFVWLRVGPAPWYMNVEIVVLYACCGYLLHLERGRTRRRRAPMLAALRVEQAGNSAGPAA